MKGKSANNNNSGFQKQVEKSSQSLRNWLWNVSRVQASVSTFRGDDLKRSKTETLPFIRSSGGAIGFRRGPQIDHFGINHF